MTTLTTNPGTVDLAAQEGWETHYLQAEYILASEGDFRHFRSVGFW
jgi:hypothetical protein